MKNNTSRRILHSFLIISFIISIIPYASALFGRRANTPEILTSFAKSTIIGEELRFSKDDFISKTTKSAELDGIIVCDLPDPQIGVLKYDGRDIQLGEALTVEGIDGIRFIPYSANAQTASFAVMPVFVNGGTSNTVTVNVNVLDEKNSAPTAENVNVITARNIAISGAFAAIDPEGGALSFNILDKPSLGNVEVCLDNPSKFMYIPFQNKTGKDSFTYVAVDSLGNTSNPATVNIRIEKPRFKLTYSDMMKSGAHYPAIVLAEKGVLKGETIGKDSFLYPKKPVTRSEFIAMTSALFNIDTTTHNVEALGFADELSTPAWAKPYISSAVKSGIITGGSRDGVMVLRPQEVLTRAEAAIIINNAMKLADVDVGFSERAAPAWAQQAAANVLNYNILSRISNGSLGLDCHVTREDAVEILYNTMLIIEK